MRLLDVKELKLHEFPDDRIPKYVILSHTWCEGEEVSYQEMLNPSDEVKRKSGYQKIVRCAEQCISTNSLYLWVDTCCIDKANYSELSEAIISMYDWYKNSVMCFAYLADVSYGNETASSNERIPGNFEHSRWFKRGWTLQELIAPEHVFLYDSDWRLIGDRFQLAELLSMITLIPKNVLRFGIDNNSVAQKMSWASQRVTTRYEDIAYCLQGVFNVRMPVMYGEKGEAFIRLQEAILKNNNDHTIFAWKDQTGQKSSYRGPLARSPAEFAHCASMTCVDVYDLEVYPYTTTNVGLKLDLHFLRACNTSILAGQIDGVVSDLLFLDEEEVYFPMLNCFDSERGSFVSIPLKRLRKGGKQFARIFPSQLFDIHKDSIHAEDLAQEMVYVRQALEIPKQHFTTRIHGIHLTWVSSSGEIYHVDNQDTLFPPSIYLTSPLDQQSSIHQLCFQSREINGVGQEKDPPKDFTLILGFESRISKPWFNILNKDSRLDSSSITTIPKINWNLDQPTASKTLSNGTTIELSMEWTLLRDNISIKVALAIMDSLDRSENIGDGQTEVEPEHPSASRTGTLTIENNQAGAERGTSTLGVWTEWLLSGWSRSIRSFYISWDDIAQYGFV